MIKQKLRPVRTLAQCRAAGDSFLGFRARLVPLMPLVRRLRIAWWVILGRDLTTRDWDWIDDSLERARRLTEGPRSDGVTAALRSAAETFHDARARDSMNDSESATENENKETEQ